MGPIHDPWSAAPSPTAFALVAHVVTGWVGSFGGPLAGTKNVPLPLALTERSDVPGCGRAYISGSTARPPLRHAGSEPPATWHCYAGHAGRARAPLLIQVVPHVQPGGTGATWAPCARIVRKWLRIGHIRSIAARHSSLILSCSCYLHGCPCRH